MLSSASTPFARRRCTSPGPCGTSSPTSRCFGQESTITAKGRFAVFQTLPDELRPACSRPASTTTSSTPTKADGASRDKLCVTMARAQLARDPALISACRRRRPPEHEPSHLARRQRRELVQEDDPISTRAARQSRATGGTGLVRLGGLTGMAATKADHLVVGRRSARARPRPPRRHRPRRARAARPGQPALASASDHVASRPLDVQSAGSSVEPPMSPCAASRRRRWHVRSHRDRRRSRPQLRTARQETSPRAPASRAVVRVDDHDLGAGQGRPRWPKGRLSGSRSVWVRTGDASVRPYTTERRRRSNRAVDCTSAGATGTPPVCTTAHAAWPPRPEGARPPCRPGPAGREESMNTVASVERSRSSTTLGDQTPASTRSWPWSRGTRSMVVLQPPLRCRGITVSQVSRWSRPMRSATRRTALATTAPWLSSAPSWDAGGARGGRSRPRRWAVRRAAILPGSRRWPRRGHGKDLRQLAAHRGLSTAAEPSSPLVARATALVRGSPRSRRRPRAWGPPAGR